MKCSIHSPKSWDLHSPEDFYKCEDLACGGNSKNVRTEDAERLRTQKPLKQTRSVTLRCAAFAWVLCVKRRLKFGFFGAFFVLLFMSVFKFFYGRHELASFGRSVEQTKSKEKIKFRYIFC